MTVLKQYSSQMFHTDSLLICKRLKPNEKDYYFFASYLLVLRYFVLKRTCDVTITGFMLGGEVTDKS